MRKPTSICQLQGFADEVRSSMEVCYAGYIPYTNIEIYLETRTLNCERNKTK